MIRVNINKLENGNLEITQNMLTDILSYMKKQDNVIKDVYSCIHHELHGHILQRDEETWNSEYYTNGKLDYRKLLIGLLSDYENRLSKGIDKDEN